jgi:hypothetical protein
VDQALGCPCGIVLVRARHMCGDRTMAAFVGSAPVAGDTFPRGEELHHGGTQAYVQLLAHQRVGHGVVVAFDLHVVINIDTGELPLGIRIGLRRQGPERRAVECVKQLLA